MYRAHVRGFRRHVRLQGCTLAVANGANVDQLDNTQLGRQQSRGTANAVLYTIQNPYLNHLNHLNITSLAGRCSNPARVQYTLRRTTCQLVQQHRWCGGGRDCIANAHHLIVVLLLNLCRCCHILCGSCLLWNTSTSLGTTWLNCLKKLQI